MSQRKATEDVASIDWCDETLRKELPWDPDQFIEVRRFSDAEQKRRKGIGARYSKVGTDDSEVQIVYDRLAAYDYDTAIIDYRLKDKTGKVLLFGKPEWNANVYEHFGKSGKMADFVDELIAEVNKETPEGVKDVKDVAGNSESSLPDK